MDGGAPTTFTATIETESTKTALGSLSGGVRPVHWSQKDTISIGGGIYEVSSIDATNPTKATFTGSGATLSEGKYKAYYPTEVYNGGTPTLPATQTYVAGRIDNLPMYAEVASSSTLLNFKNLCAVLEVKLSGDGSKRLRRIEVSSTGTNKYLSGPFTVNWNNENPTLTFSSGASQLVTLDCGNTGVLLTSTEQSFFIAIPAQEYTAGTLTVTAYDTANQQIASFPSKTTSTLQRSMIYEVKKAAGIFADPYPYTQGQEYNEINNLSKNWK